MKRFRFGLDRLLDLRRSAEQERAQALGAARREEEEHRRSLDACAERLQRAADQLPGPRAALPAGALRNLSLTVEALVRQAEAAAASHAAAAREVEQHQHRFQHARAERRVVELLREHRFAAWAREASREEQKVLDEIALRTPRPGESAP